MVGNQHSRAHGHVAPVREVDQDSSLIDQFADLERALGKARTAFEEEREARFKETATLTRLLEDERQRHQHELETWQAKARRRHRGLKTANSQLNRIKQNMKEVTQRLHVLEADLAERERRHRRDQRELRKIKGSYSWRMTEPLRRARRASRRIVHMSKRRGRLQT